MNTLKIIKGIILIIISVSIKAQDNQYLFVGYDFNTIKNTDAITLLVNDFNAHNRDIHLQVTDELKTPGIVNGFLFGMKFNSKKLNAGFEIHLQRASSSASGYDSIGVNEYYRRIKVSHPGISMFYGYNIINAKKFRISPTLALNIEKFKVYHRASKISSYRDWDQSVDKFFMSATLRFPLSFGGAKFNFDIVPYYTLPFWQVNVKDLNGKLNLGYEKTYTDSQMELDASNYGVMFTFNFKMNK